MKDISISSVDIDHHIQRAILVQLRQDGPQTYAQLKPDGVEGNAYNYHLKNLKQSGLVVLEDARYSLTQVGNVVADSFSNSAKRLLLRPALYTHILVTQKDMALVYHPTRQPLANRISLPSGKYHYGDSFNDSIAREMTRRELSPEYAYRQLCPISVRYLRESAVIMHRPGLVWHVEYHGELREKTTESGHSRWMQIDALRDDAATPSELHLILQRYEASDSQPIDLQISVERSPKVGK